MLAPTIRHGLPEPTEEQTTLLRPKDDPRVDDADATYRVGQRIQLATSFAAAAEADALPDGRRTHRRALRCETCAWIALSFSGLRLPPAARLYVHGRDGVGAQTAYTASEVADDLSLATPPIPGQRVVVEYVPAGEESVPAQAFVESATLGSSRAFAGWDATPAPAGGRALSAASPLGGAVGDGGTCMVDSACDSEWSNAARGVVAMLIGGGLCSASLINACGAAGAVDAPRYVLTGYHCIRDIVEARISRGAPSGALNTLIDAVFIYNWRSPGCASPQPPRPWRGEGLQSTYGAYITAYANDSDFALLRLSRAPPRRFGVRANGWNATASAPPRRSALLHFPRGDLLKVSVPAGVPALRRFCPSCCTAVGTSVTGSGRCWRSADYHVERYALGSSAPGSSGGPLFDGSGAIVGQMHGGYATCAHPRDDFFGRLAVAYNNSLRYDQPLDGARLQPHLDPRPDGSRACGAADYFAPPSDARPLIRLAVPSHPRVSDESAKGVSSQLELRSGAWFGTKLQLALTVAPAADVRVTLVLRRLSADGSSDHGLAADADASGAGVGSNMVGGTDQRAAVPSGDFELSERTLVFPVATWYVPREVTLRAMRAGARAMLWFEVKSADPDSDHMRIAPLYAWALGGEGVGVPPLCATNSTGASATTSAASSTCLCDSEPCVLSHDDVGGGNVQFSAPYPFVISLGSSSGALVFDECPAEGVRPVASAASSHQTEALLPAGRYALLQGAGAAPAACASPVAACEALWRAMERAPALGCSSAPLSHPSADLLPALDIDGDGQPEALARLVLSYDASVQIDTCGSKEDLRLRLFDRCPWFVNSTAAARGSPSPTRAPVLLDGDSGSPIACRAPSTHGLDGNDALVRGRLSAGEYWLLIDSDGAGGNLSAAAAWRVRLRCDPTGAESWLSRIAEPGTLGGVSAGLVGSVIAAMVLRRLRFQVSKTLALF